ncbi:MAG: hypothetical protein U0Y68_04685 [Blastocatellia bacterium]
MVTALRTLGRASQRRKEIVKQNSVFANRFSFAASQQKKSAKETSDFVSFALFVSQKDGVVIC